MRTRVGPSIAVVSAWTPMESARSVGAATAGVVGDVLSASAIALSVPPGKTEGDAARRACRMRRRASPGTYVFAHQLWLDANVRPVVACARSQYVGATLASSR